MGKSRSSFRNTRDFPLPKKGSLATAIAVRVQFRVLLQADWDWELIYPFLASPCVCWVICPSGCLLAGLSRCDLMCLSPSSALATARVLFVFYWYCFRSFFSSLAIALGFLPLLLLILFCSGFSSSSSVDIVLFWLFFLFFC